MHGILMRFCMALLACAALSAQPSVSTGQYDNSRSNANAAEVILTQTNVAAHFGLLGKYSVGDYVYGQPLVIAGSPRLLIACAMNGTCYAFDAEAAGSAAIWTTHLGTPWSTGG